MTQEDKDQLWAYTRVFGPWVAGFVAILAAIVFVFSPCKLPEGITIASANMDRDRLVQLIDYELVVTSAAATMQRNLEGEELILGGPLAQTIAESVLTPQNTMKLFNGDEISFIGLSKDDFDHKSLKATYKDINTYQWEINSKPVDNSYNHYTITAKRRGFASWQVIKLTFVINKYIPATSLENTFVTPVARSFTTPQGNIACKVDTTSVSCAYTSNDTSLLSAYCTQEGCVYNGKDINREKYPAYLGTIQVGNISCTSSDTVTCTSKDSSFTIGDGTFFTTGDPESPFNEGN